MEFTNKFTRTYSRDNERNETYPRRHDYEDRTEYEPESAYFNPRRFNVEREGAFYHPQQGNNFYTNRYDNEFNRYNTKFRLRRELPEFRPEEVKIKLDPVYYTLNISAKRVNQPFQAEQEKFYMRKEVIPLPENIRLEELRVKFTPRGDLLVKAPYQNRDDFYQPRNRRTGEYDLPIAFRDISGKREQNPLLPNGQVDTNKCSVQQYLRLLKNSSFPNTLSTQCVRDETTGKWKIFFDVNTVGFRREEVQVHFQEKERLLIVEAKHEQRGEQNVQGISVKTLRREFILPEFLDGKQMRYRIMNTGVLRIQLPCLRDPCPKMCREEEDFEQFRTQQQRQQQPATLNKTQ